MREENLHSTPHISLNPGSSIMNNLCCIFSSSEKGRGLVPVLIQIFIYSFQCTTLPEKVGAVMPQVTLDIWMTTLKWEALHSHAKRLIIYFASPLFVFFKFIYVATIVSGYNLEKQFIV